MRIATPGARRRGWLAVSTAVLACVAAAPALADGFLLANARDLAQGSEDGLVMLPDATIVSMAEVRLALREQGAATTDTVIYETATGHLSVRVDAAVSELLLDEPTQRIVLDEPNFVRLADRSLADTNRISRFAGNSGLFFEAYPGTQYGASVLDQRDALVWVGGVARAYTARLPRANPFQPDSDGDIVPDEIDNCTFIANGTQQLDTNGDGFGNRCDADLNNDCIVNAIDLGLLRTEFFSTGALDQDFSGDGVVNAIDLGILRTQFFSPPGPSALATCGASGLP